MKSPKVRAVTLMSQPEGDLLWLQSENAVGSGKHKSATPALHLGPKPLLITQMLWLGHETWGAQSTQAEPMTVQNRETKLGAVQLSS